VFENCETDYILISANVGAYGGQLPLRGTTITGMVENHGEKMGIRIQVNTD
jgi:hypothetical protein